MVHNKLAKYRNNTVTAKLGILLVTRICMTTSRFQACITEFQGVRSSSLRLSVPVFNSANPRSQEHP